MRDAGLEQRRGAHPGLHERRGAAAHPRDGRDPLLQPFAGSAVAKGGDLGQRPAPAPAALRLRRRRAGGAGRARGPGLPHRRARLLLSRPGRQRRPGARRRGRRRRARARGPRGAGRARADARRPSPRATRGLLHGRPARRPRADRRQGARGGRGGRARRARGVRRARRRGGRRPALPPRGPACSPATSRSAPPSRRSMAVAAEPSHPGLEPSLDRARELAARFERHPGGVSVRRRLRDAGLRIPEAA